jgi:ribosome recycling factor
MQTTAEVKKDSESKMKKTVDSTLREFATVRTGRANTALVDSVTVDYYGTMTSLKQMANVTTPDAASILINPWDKNAIGDIERAIDKANLGLTASNDGKVVRVIIPHLTEERREELKKVLKQTSENGKISLRTVRRHANDVIDKLEKDKTITEDDKFSSKEDIQKMIEKYEKEVDDLLKKKEVEIMTI